MPWRPGHPTRNRFTQTIGADPLAADQLGQVLRLLVVCAERPNRQDGETGLCAEGRAERAGVTQPARDDGRGDLVHRDPAKFFRHVGAEQTKLSAPAQQLTGQIPVLGLELVDAVDDFIDNELLRRPIDEALLFGHPLGCEHPSLRCVLEKPGASLLDRHGRCNRHRTSQVFYSLSKIPAAPMPPPTHIVTRPYRPFRR